MRHPMRSVALAVLVSLGSACDVAADDNDGFAGGIYRGRVSAQVFEPGRTPAGRESGTGSAEFMDRGDGRSQLTVKANIRRPGDAGFVLEGSGNGSGWQGRADGLRLDIDRNGRISGGGVVDRHRIVFGGTATAQRLNLRVETVMLAKSTVGTFPVGTRTVFDYALASKGASTGIATEAAAEKKGAKTCKRRVWKMRNVATPGGGMTMTQVPHCLD